MGISQTLDRLTLASSSLTETAGHVRDAVDDAQLADRTAEAKELIRDIRSATDDLRLYLREWDARATAMTSKIGDAADSHRDAMAAIQYGAWVLVGSAIGFLAYEMWKAGR